MIIKALNCGYRIVVVRDLPKVVAGVRFPLPAPVFAKAFSRRSHYGEVCSADKAK